MIFEDFIIDGIVKHQATDIDKAIIDYLKQLGYEIKEPYLEDIKTIQKELLEKGQMIRVEIFNKTVEYKPSSISLKTCVIPFIDSINNPLSKDEVKKTCKLDDEWY